MFVKIQRYAILLFLSTICLNVNSQQIVSYKLNWSKDNSKGALNNVCESCFYSESPENTAFISSKIVNYDFIEKFEMANISVQEVEDFPITNNDFNIKYEIGRASNDNILYCKVNTYRKNKVTNKTEKLLAFDLKIIGKTTQKLNISSGTRSATNSVLAINDWYKISIKEAGIYKIDYDFVKNILKLDPANVNLNACGIFGSSNGSLPTLNSDFRYDDLPENASKVYDFNKNNKLDAGDYILFYAHGNTRWDLVDSFFKHTAHIYSDKSHYFFTPNGGTNNRIVEKTLNLTTDKVLSNYSDHFLYEKELENSLKSGRVWLGDVFSSPATTKVFPFTIPNVEPNYSARLYTSYAAGSKSGNSSIEVNINNQSTNFVIGTTGEKYILTGHNMDIKNPTDNLQISYTFKNSSVEAKGNLDFATVNLKRKFIFNGEQLNFRSIEEIGNNKNLEINFQTNSNFEIWNTTALENAYQVKTTPNGSGINKFVFNNNTLQEWVIFDPLRTYKPEYVAKVENQNLHNLPQADYFIITPNNFLSAAEKLAQFHRDRNKLKVNVVDIEKLYNEFSSGTKDLTAIRDMLKMFYERAGGVELLKPKSVLLLGDASYDYKGIVGKDDIIPTYESINSWEANESYNTDDYIAYLDPNEGGDDIILGNNYEDIGVGRIPANNLEQAMGVVNKIINYKNAPASFKDWRNYITLVADDVDDAHDYAFQQQSEDFIARIVQDSLKRFNLEKIYLDAYNQESSAGGSRYPDANKILLDRINFGSLAISYIGHGGPTNWAQERLFGNTEILGLKNFNALPFFITATCDFSPFDNPMINSAGENLIMNPSGGAVSIISTTRTVYISNNGTLVQNFFSVFFDKKDNRYLNLGEITRRTKVKQAKDNNARKFVLLGDPALTLNYPELSVVTTSINNNINFNNDTLKALQKIIISGEVRDLNNNLASEFNGICYPTIFDKAEAQKTLKNDASSIDFNFKLQKNIVFKGKSTVKNGKFEFTFIVPKDINYSVGSGKISYYAESATSGGTKDANGYNIDFMIGSSDDNAITDNVGPKINLFMNKENFINGGITDENPLLLAKLFDESGINTVGNGIGHDIAAVIDENTKNAIVLNNFYESEINDYTKGKVNYNFYKLSEGKHTLKVKAWDVYNNPGEASLEFIVAKNSKIVLNQLMNYPNPFSTNTCFQFEHNKAGEPLEITIQIFSLAGQLVKSYFQKITPDSYKMEKQLCWDGLDNYGDYLVRGLYIYKVMIKDTSGNTADAVEKLVIINP